MVTENENKKYVYLADVIMAKARELKIDSLRKPFWDLKSEITEQVSNGKIPGRVGREVEIDPDALDKFIKDKKKSLNITDNEEELEVKAIKDLIIKLMDAGFKPEKVLTAVCIELGIISLEGINK